MKYNKMLGLLTGLFVLGTVSHSCKEFLDRAPLSSVTPEVFFANENDLASYLNSKYVATFPSPADWSMPSYAGDVNSDNQVGESKGTALFAPGEVKVGSGIENWEFTQIRFCNYFLSEVLPRWKAGAILGSKTNIDHYLGEAYFMRGLEYFNKVQSVGDFPIIKNVLPDNLEVLAKANERKPRNEVMRQVISDLDSAIMLLSNAPMGGKNRITKNAALLIKSRAALYEGSFLKNFKGTAYVPLGAGWPGLTKEYSKNYQYPSGNIDNEINWFLDQAIDAADQVASKLSLTINNLVAAEIGEKILTNPYFVMFNDTRGLESYSEVILWRDYNASQKVAHTNQGYLQGGSNGTGLTRGFVDNFLMENGLPIYVVGSGYLGDKDFTSFRKGRDWRLQLFVKVKGDWNVLADGNRYSAPHILENFSTGGDFTGYSGSKGMDFANWGAGSTCENDQVIYRAAEAYLNYIEAFYLRNGSIGGNSDKYWRALRTRAGIDPNYHATIAATMMSVEAKNDWAAYSAGVLIDATLYNIRRERRCEFVLEGMRWNDLVRWRAMDQMITNKYQIEGFNLWGGDNAKDYVTKEDKTKTRLKWMGDKVSNSGYNVSAPEVSDYLRPFQKVKANNLVYDGFSWHSAHYLNPIGANNFLLTAPDGIAVDASPIYPNPGWSTAPNSAPTVVKGF